MAEAFLKPGEGGNFRKRVKLAPPDSPRYRGKGRKTDLQSSVNIIYLNKA